jgi:hypothetical protein
MEVYAADKFLHDLYSLHARSRHKVKAVTLKVCASPAN